MHASPDRGPKVFYVFRLEYKMFKNTGSRSSSPHYFSKKESGLGEILGRAKTF